MRLLLVTIALVLVAPTSAMARTVAPGSVWAGADLGPGFKLGSQLGGSGGYLLLGAKGEYAINKAIGVVADFQLGNLGFIGTAPLRFRVGGRYRLTGLDLPVAPYGEAKLGIGQLRDVINTNLTWMGLHVGAGADYFLTAKLAVGGKIGLDLGTTLSDRSSFYGTFEVMATASYALWDPSPPPPTVEADSSDDAGDEVEGDVSP